MEIKKIAIVCGGPSAERGISLNSARSLYDNFDKDIYDIELIYFNPKLEPFRISPTQIYSNTPLDFDYKLKHDGNVLSKDELKTLLQKVDIVFPAIHGFFGEDGQLQRMLEEFNVKYSGSGPEACYNTSNKHKCQEILKKNGFFTITGHVLKKGDPIPDLKPGKYIIKPLHGGSSLGVKSFDVPIKDKERFTDICTHVFEHEEQALIEPFFNGTEFTIIVLENEQGNPVSLLPTEIEFASSDDLFFNYRKKYLATAETRYHTPARFSQETTERIQKESQKVFSTLGIKDFTRIDDWLTEDGTIWFSDINAISGMEQNSFLFQQAALFGISHYQLLDYILHKKIKPLSQDYKNHTEIPVLFGGNTAERQVSVMSGTNVWMKLKSSNIYRPTALFLDKKGDIYRIPQFICLHHTAEEIEEKIQLFQSKDFYSLLKKEQSIILSELGIKDEELGEQIFVPEKITLEEIASNCSFLFLGLHGGDGENGVIQKKLEDLNLPYNGPGVNASQICMDKLKTGQIIEQSNTPGISTAKKRLININEDPELTWNDITCSGFHTPLIIKPRGDGCSAGIIRIDSKEEFIKVIDFYNSKHPFIPANTIHEHHGQIDLPHESTNELLLEEFIITDEVRIKNLKIDWQSKTDIIEVTVAVIGDKGNMIALHPSQTIVNQDTLSLEEKFMGGTGVNLTPPPDTFVKSDVVRGVQSRIEQVAKLLDLECYSRIDTFMNIKTGDLTIIEVNTLPGLTPSTVLFHQGLSGQDKKTPLQLLEKIIEIGLRRYQKKSHDDRKVGSIKKTSEIESFENSRI